jgi:hypothetical protein
VALAPSAQAQVLAQTRPLGGGYSRPQQGIFGPPVGAISKATGQQLRAQPVGKVVPGAIAHARSGNPRANPPARAGRPPGSPKPPRGGPPPAYRGGRGKRR